MEITITFGPSTSCYYEKAEAMAARLGGTEQDDDTIIRLQSAEFMSCWREMQDLWDVIGKWKSALFEIDGKQVEWAYGVFQITECADQCLDAPSTRAWCRSGTCWNCNFLDSITETGWNSGGRIYAWWEFGEFDSDYIWHMDIERIRRVLLRQYEKKRLGLCPHFKLTDLEKTIRQLPEIIDPKTNEFWEFRDEPQYVKGIPRRVRVGVQPIQPERPTFQPIPPLNSAL